MSLSVAVQWSLVLFASSFFRKSGTSGKLLPTPTRSQCLRSKLGTHGNWGTAVMLHFELRSGASLPSLRAL
eukprot:2046764-Amphidinium_carterae.2